MAEKNPIYGLVVCGGKSSRMGVDKGLMSYRGKAQRYYAYEMLEGLCAKAYISCSPSQAEYVDLQYRAIADLPEFAGRGPMAALLTGFAHHPNGDLLVVGCDYPFLTKDELENFLSMINPTGLAAAFYNRGGYEPVIAWYSHRAAWPLKKAFDQEKYSLNEFLESVSAQKHYPKRPESSVDTPEDAAEARWLLRKEITGIPAHG